MRGSGRGTGGGSSGAAARAPRRPAISEILSVIMITVALSVGTGVFLYTYQDRQDVSEEVVLGHLDLSRMRASELVTWSSAHCSADDGSLNFLLHNYGADNLSTADMRIYGSWSGSTFQLSPANISYATLSGDPIAGDIGGGEAAWARVEMGCGSMPPGNFDWRCGNSRFAQPGTLSCAETRVSLITPAEDVVRVEPDGWREPRAYPTVANVVSCTPGIARSEVCFDLTEQPLPLTGIEVWHMTRGPFERGTTRPPIQNITAADIRVSADGSRACIDLAPAAYHDTIRFLMVNEEGKSSFNQRPYMGIHGTGQGSDKFCRVLPYGGGPPYVTCPDGTVVQNTRSGDVC